MREMKFRYIAEYEEGKFFCNTDPYDVYLSLEDGAIYSFDGDKISEKVEQFTGLHDKNGREIYEGDIVEAWSQGVRATGEIKQRIDGLWLMYPAWQKGIIWSLAPDQYDGSTTVEVIGNRWEHPHLLKKGEQA